MAEDREESGEGQVEGSQGGDGPGREGKGGAHLWLGIPHVRHSQCKYPPKMYVVYHISVADQYLRAVTFPGPGKRPRMFDKRNIGYRRLTRVR